MIRFAIFLCAAVLGFALMGFEMVASRMLTPYFGSEIFTWAALIAVVLLAIMLGYFIGGTLIDRYPTFRLAAGFSAVAAAWIALTPALRDWQLGDIMNSIEDVRWGVVVGALLLCLVPATALGTFSPIALRLLIRDVGSSGRTSGLIYGVSTFGNIIGTVGTTLVLIQNYGTATSAYILAAAVAVCAVILALLPNRIRA